MHDLPHIASRLFGTPLLIARANPARSAMLPPFFGDYYWTTFQSEWASDVMFRMACFPAAVYTARRLSGRRRLDSV